MNPIIATIYKAIDDAEKNGTSAIGTEELKAYLLKLSELQEIDGKDEDAAIELEKYKAHLSKWVEEHKSFNQWGFEFFRATISAGQSALKSAILINGGASIALFTFIGKLWGNPNTQAAQLIAPLQLFLFGVLFAAIAAGTTYLAQWFYSGRKPWLIKIANVSNITSILLVLGSYGSFLYGVLRVSAIFIT